MKKSIGTKLHNVIFNNVFLKIASVLLAVLLWLLVINIDDPQTTTTIKNIPVTILYDEVITDNDEVYDVLSGNTIDVKITGPRTILDSLKASDFTATADFRDLSKTNAVPINVSINRGSYESKVTISEKSENTMRLSIEAITEKDYNLSVEYRNSLEEGYIVYKTSTDIDFVTVRAPQSVQSQISKVVAVVNFAGNETADFEYTGSVVLYDYSGNVINPSKNHTTLSESYIKVNGTVYYQKKVDVLFNLVDELSDDLVLSGYNSNLKQITVMGRKAVLDAVSSVTVPDDLTVITDDQTTLSIDLRNVLPEGVLISGDDYMLEIDATTEEIVEKTFKVETSEVAIRSIPEGYESSILNNGTINLVISGKAELLDEIAVESLAPYVSMVDGVEGINSVKVNILSIDGVTLKSDVYITVILSLRNEETSTPDQETSTEEETTDDATTASPEE